MKKGKNFAPKTKGMLPGILMGAWVSVSIYLLGAAILAWLIVFEKVSEGAVDLGASLILLLGAWAGSATAKGLQKEGPLMVWAAHAGVTFGLLLACALAFGGGFERLGVTTGMILLGGGLALIPEILGHRSGGKKYKIKAFR